MTETLLAQIEILERRVVELEAERDAAIADLKYIPPTTCKYANTDYCTNNCLCDKYKWRGIRD